MTENIVLPTVELCGPHVDVTRHKNEVILKYRATDQDDGLVELYSVSGGKGHQTSAFLL